jgi:ribosomal protein L31E
MLALDLVKTEFKSREKPSWSEACMYADIALRGTAPWWKRAERALAILRHGLHKRSKSRAG